MICCDNLPDHISGCCVRGERRAEMMLAHGAFIMSIALSEFRSDAIVTAGPGADQESVPL